ncbi:MAG: carboxymuconolactone decarboxylase family protein [Actinomycetales bacterium]|nr:carboxymuconolactone decarboxylase family protein [Actinomycetales bacterium]
MTTQSDQPARPALDEVLATITASLNGHLPDTVRLAAQAMPEMVYRHTQDGAFAMPKEGGALTPQTRTLIYLGIALATGSHCIEAMMNKATAQGIDAASILETFKIARFAEATRVFGNAEYVFARLADQQ